MKTRFSNLTSKNNPRGCPKCGGTKKLSIEEVKERLYKTNPTVTLISNEYINSDIKLTVKCQKCLHIWQATFHKLTSSDRPRGCPNCKRLKIHSVRKLKKEDVTKRISKKSPYIAFHIKEYEGVEQRVKCYCTQCNHRWEASINNLLRGRGCPVCRYINLRGVKHPRYNFKLTEKEREKFRYRVNHPETRKWRNNVFQKDNYKCVICNKGGCLQAHHLNGFHWFKEGRFEIDNGITLCKEHHKNFHKQYGYKNNTKEQFKEYMKHAH